MVALNATISRKIALYPRAYTGYCHKMIIAELYQLGMTCYVLFFLSPGLTHHPPERVPDCFSFLKI